MLLVDRLLDSLASRRDAAGRRKREDNAVASAPGMTVLNPAPTVESSTDHPISSSAETVETAERDIPLPVEPQGMQENEAP